MPTARFPTDRRQQRPPSSTTTTTTAPHSPCQSPQRVASMQKKCTEQVAVKWEGNCVDQKVSSTFCVVYSPSSPPPPLPFSSLSSLTQDTSSPHTHALPASPCPLTHGLVYACAAWPGTGGPNAWHCRPPCTQRVAKTGNRWLCEQSPFFPHALLEP